MDSAAHNRIHDVFHVFWEALVQQHHLERMEDNKPRTWEDARRPLPADWHTGATVSLATWLNMWGGLCHNASGLGDFPNWIRTIPDIFFDLIDRDSDGVISEEELEDFFVRFLGMKDNVRERVKDIYHDMTMVCE